MRQIMDANGGVLHSTREYDIATGTAIKRGQVVRLLGGLVVPAGAGETGAILGYAAEYHSGAPDAVDPRSDGAKILVEDAPAALAESGAPVLVATGGTATTLTASGVAAFAANAFKGGYVKKTGDGVRAITASAVTGDMLTLTLEAGVAPVAGERYILFLPWGFVGGNLSSDGKITLAATAALPIMVIGRDEMRDMVWTMATRHLLAAGR